MITARTDTSTAQSLSLRQSPCPRAVRFIVSHLYEPTSVAQVENNLPVHIRQQILYSFSSFREFVAAHKLHLFEREGGMLWSHMMAKQHRETDNGVASSPEALAKKIHAMLPEKGYVAFRYLENNLSPSEMQFINAGVHPRNFLEAYPQYFSAFCLLWHQGRLYVQRAGLPIPPNVLPKVTTAYGMLFELALVALEETPEALALTYLSTEARALVKVYDGLLAVVESFPQWFQIVQRKPQLIIKYIGHLIPQSEVQKSKQQR